MITNYKDIPPPPPPPPPPIVTPPEVVQVEVEVKQKPQVAHKEEERASTTDKKESFKEVLKSKEESDKSQEFVVDNERALLSIALRNSEYLGELCSKITPDFFLFRPNRLIYLAMSSLFSSVKRIDLGTLNIRCDELGLDKTARDKYLPLLFNSSFDDSSFDLHLKSVKNAYIKYQLHIALSKSMGQVENNKQSESSLDGDDLLKYASEEISKLNSCRGLEAKVVCFSDRARDLVKERVECKADVQGIRTGIEELDKAINGLQDGTLTVVAARMKVGKSALLANIADYVAYETEQCSVLFISTEMKTDEDILRTLAIRTYIKERSIANGKVYEDPEEGRLLDAALEKIEGCPTQIYHEYMPNFTVESVVARCKYWRKKIDNLGLIIFDYIKMPPARDLGQVNFKEHQLLGELTTALKNQVAGEEDIAVVTACQLNRENEVADSDRIARYANNMLKLRFQTQEEFGKHGDGQTYGTHFLEIKETRSGGTGQWIPLRFYKTCLKFKEAELYEDEDSDEEAPTIQTPLEQARLAEKKFKKPSNVTNQDLEMTMGQLIKGFTDNALKDKLEKTINDEAI